MALLPWNRRFFVSTRGRIVTLLRRSSRTVDELAGTLGLTDNAVRAHLATLERDGFVQQQGARRGSGKPAYVYSLSQEAEQLFPKAYGSVLHELLDVLRQEMTTQEVDALMRTTGRRIASQWNIPPGPIQVRLRAAVEILNELGGLAELEEYDGVYTIRGYSCPLAALAPGHPEVCHLTETLLTELVDVPVQEHCDSCEQQRCRFVVQNA
jgi:predicted ArsR family transcriptional regulator